MPSVEQSPLAPASPCSPVENFAALPAAEKDQATGCAKEVDLGIRPLTTGTLHLAMTNAARANGSRAACCYQYRTFGNR